MSKSQNQQRVRAVYRALAQAWGHQHWWPAETAFEVIVGAYLTQNTAWTNVERAMSNLRQANALSLEAIRSIPLADLEQLIRPAGYFRQKAARLKTFIAFVDARYGSLERMFAAPTAQLRQELLALNGVGPETADSILLYAGGHEVFVVDAYTRRLVERHGMLEADADYEVIRELWEAALRAEVSVLGDSCLVPDLPVGQSATPASDGRLRGAAHLPSAMSCAQRSPLAQLYSEMHALIVGAGKRHCFKTAPNCDGCPLQPLLPVRRGRSRTEGRSAGAKPRATL